MMKRHRTERGVSQTACPASPEGKAGRRIPRLRRGWRWLVWSCGSLVTSVVLYFAAGWMLGHIPTNRSFRNAQEGVEIAVVHNGVHCDIAVPVYDTACNWNEVLGLSTSIPAVQGFQYARIGWGNRRFYLETPRWADLKVKTALEAISGFGSTAVHVDLIRELPPSGERCRRLRLSAAQYQKLCGEILKSLSQDEHRRGRQIPAPGYSHSDAFYEGVGNYHLLRTCNVWTGDVLRRSGVRIGVWTPFPSSVFASLPDEESR